MQRSMDLLATGCANFGLNINKDQTVVMHRPPPGADHNAPRINLNGAELKNVDKFAYLGSTLSLNTRIHDGLLAGSPKPAKTSTGFKPLYGIFMVSSCPRN
ncbi:unnamed protein product [Dibothriocephalus latus]|uniref:Reverse transcriptase domain-containing protein n=1 Tax=Dibothriocephalus latus TaxID=60516 RepID=A0A3P7PQ88_DIBLA|nr:unnamed protein product [Dibothriocephalus latus]